VIESDSDELKKVVSFLEKINMGDTAEVADGDD